MSNINAYYFPTTVLMLDDDESFLKGFSQLMSDRIKILEYSDSELALDKIIKNENDSILNTSFFEVLDDSPCGGYKINLDRMIEIKNVENKTNIISTIVVDYSMPKINGIEFCNKFNNIKIPKIMLTGEADFSIAVDAFNEGIIDAFIVKGSKGMRQNFIKQVDSMQTKFFQRLSYPIINLVLNTSESLIDDEMFQNLFQRICKENNISEYYLIDHMGTFLLVDKDGNEKYFSAATSKDFDDYIDIAKYGNADLEILSELKSRKALPFFKSESDRKIPVSGWKNILKPVEKHGNIYSMVSD